MENRTYMTELEQQQREWDLSKFSDNELIEEIRRRNQKEAREANKEYLYAKKDVIAFDEHGNPYDTEAY